MTKDTIQPFKKNTSNPSVYSLILNYNNYSETIETIESLFSLDYDSNTIILIENSTDENIIRKIRSKFPFLEIIENKKNLGYTGGNNVGIRTALANNAEYIFVINNDVILERDVLTKCIDAIKVSPDCAACQPLVSLFNNRKKIWSAGTQMFLGYPRLFLKGKPIKRSAIIHPPFGLVGCAILFKASAIKEIGLFDESLFMMHEETDWCIRAKHLNFSLLVVMDALVYHKVSTTIGLFSKEYLYYIGRNWLLVGRKNCRSIRYWYILITEITIRFPYYVYYLTIKQQIGLLKYYLRGIIDGLRGVTGKADFEETS